MCLACPTLALLHHTNTCQQIVATGLGLQQLTLQPPPAAAPDARSTASRIGSSADVPQQLLVVSFVVEDSPAAKAGVKEGDAVLNVAGQAVSSKELRWAGRAHVPHRVWWCAWVPGGA